jgi:hypothetical protein
MTRYYWKQALDKNKYTAAILMDISKTFNCLPHDLLINKPGIHMISCENEVI